MKDRWLAQFDTEIPGLLIAVRVEHGVCTGVYYRKLALPGVPQQPLMSRDLRRPFRPSIDAACKPRAVESPRIVWSGRRGPGYYPETHWRAVYDLWQEALVESPQRPLTWMAQRCEPRPSSSTMHRWVERARRNVGGA